MEITEIIKIIHEIENKQGPERAAMCARDCLYQHELNQLEPTIKAWRNYLIDSANHESSLDEEYRHKCYVPAIPL